MARRRSITVRGRQRADIDAEQLARVLLAIAAEWDQNEPLDSPDVFEAAIEDRGSRQEQAG